MSPISSPLILKFLYMVGTKTGEHCVVNGSEVENRWFPKEKELRRRWEIALRREGFSAGKSTVLCSEHFKPEDFDRTGQTVRIRDGVKPSVFNFPAHLQKAVATRTTRTSRKAEQSLAVKCCLHFKKTEPPPNEDHSYALPSSLSDLKARLNDALARVESLEREMRNVKDRERRAKNAVYSLLADLRRKNITNKEPKKRLDFNSRKKKIKP
ncbi:hypothetical protein GJAV_G00041960 [Gymnothorax javanicus]|nr:hypothetical protein GJAV_G00041960 [Gymnothorax javanicus]